MVVKTMEHVQPRAPKKDYLIRLGRLHGEVIGICIQRTLG